MPIYLWDNESTRANIMFETRDNALVDVAVPNVGNQLDGYYFA